VLRSLAKRIGPNHELALELWQKAVREPRILASLLDEPERVTEAQMDRWAEAFDSWEICDQCCQNLFWRTPFALARALAWTRRPEEFVKRAGFVLVAVLAVHDRQAEDETFVGLLFDADRCGRRRASLRPERRHLGTAADRQTQRSPTYTCVECGRPVPRQRPPCYSLGRARCVEEASASSFVNTALSRAHGRTRSSA
jgi:hypothetical protein